MLKKRVRIFGRSVPLAAIATLVAVIGVAAWVGYLTFAGSVAVATAPMEGFNPVSPAWDCSWSTGGGLFNTGLVEDFCGNSATGGPEMVFSGLSEDNLQVDVARQFRNDTPSTKCFGVVSGTIPPHLTFGLKSGAPSLLIASGATADVEFRLKSVGIGPSESLSIPDLVVGSVACP